MRIALTTALAVAFGLMSVADAPGAEAAPSQIVICPTCSKHMPASFYFCSNCGTNLERVPRTPGGGAATKKPANASTAGAAAMQTKTCPTCGLHMPTNFKFCSNCGTDIEKVHRVSSGGATSHSASAPHSALSNKPAPLNLVGFPQRPAPIVEIGLSPFLGVGPIAPGFVMPTGAVWQPDFIVFGTARTAIQTFDNGLAQVTEWVSRLDIYGNLFLTPTERILIGFRPLDINGLEYSGYRFSPNAGWVNDLNGTLTTLFFQGDLGELFPNLDLGDTKGLDIGFAVGRQPLSFQDGIMINEDVIDAFGITRTSNFFLGASSWRMTGIFAWNELSRNNNVTDDSAKLFGFFNTADYATRTIDLDFAYVTARPDNAGGSGIYVGVGNTQRFGQINSTTRVNASFALDRETPAVSTGVLLFQQLSTTLPDSNDVFYLNAFWAIDDYSSAARGSDRGGPLGATGILFAAQGLGAYGAPLGNRANSAVGGALGYQKFIGGVDRQLIFEIGGRVRTEDPRFFGLAQPNSVAAAVRYQMKLGQHFVLIFDTFVGFPENRDTAYGLRSELLVKF